MAIVTMSCWRATREGEWNHRALAVEFATKTPFFVYFFETTLVAFRFGPRMTVLEGSAPRSYLRELEALMEETEVVHLGVFGYRLDALVKRLFTPADLDADTPPGIVADWLDDRGLFAAAQAVRKNHM